MSAIGAPSTPTIVVYLSGLIGAPVTHPTGARLGTVRDLVVEVGREACPTVKGLVVSVGALLCPTFVPWNAVASIAPSGVHLRTTQLDLRPFERQDAEVLLAGDVLAKQVLDVAGRRLVRAADLQLAQFGRVLRLVAVDVSTAGFLARAVPSRLRFLIEHLLPRELISWSQVEFFASEAPEVTLQVPHDKIARLHPADIAALIQKLPQPLAKEVLTSLPNDVAAHIIQELEPPVSTALITALSPVDAATILDRMDPAAAADLLADLPVQKAEDLLHAMERCEAAQVQRLLTYPEDSAGGMMTTEFVAMPEYLTARQAINRLRQQKELPENIYDLYVVSHETNGQLVGVVTLRYLATAPTDALLRDIMVRDVIKAHVDDPADEVARTIAHYNLLALPVVDLNDHLLGVVAVDDAIDVILPEEWRRRVPRVFRR